PGGKETEISEVDVHLRLGQAGHCEAEIEAAAIVGVTLEEDLEPLASELVAQGRKECHRGEVAVAYAPGGLRDLALRPDRLHPAILPGADRQGMAAEFRPVLGRAHGRWRQGQGRRGLGGGGGGDESEEERDPFHRCAPWYSGLGSIAVAEAIRLV